MKIRTRLFLGTTLLVLALVAVQWWLQARQIAGLHRELAAVAATVGEGLVLSDFLRFAPLDPAGRGPSPGQDGTGLPPQGQAQVEWSTADAPGEDGASNRKTLTHKVFVRSKTKPEGEGPHPGHAARQGFSVVAVPEGGALVMSDHLQRVDVKVIAEHASAEKVLIVRTEPGGERRITLPTGSTERVMRGTFRHGLAASGLVLLAGILGAAVISHRLTRPVRSLAGGLEAVGAGAFGTRIEVTEPGELGEAQRRFNEMSARLAALEQEKQAWAAREHLAELGALARGLAHTLRNPLNTLGLVVEELADRGGGARPELVSTARSQIRRIDRWVVSFLALGAGRAAEPERLDLAELVRAVVLEAVQGGGRVVLAPAPEDAIVAGVPRALHAALSNLIENAVEASPDGGEVEVEVARDGGEAVIRVTDRGEGVPAEVRERLFQPHVTTKPGGSGMGLFLSRQLIAAGHHGLLELADAAGGGTVATVRLPLAPSEEVG